MFHRDTCCVGHQIPIDSSCIMSWPLPCTVPVSSCPDLCCCPDQPSLGSELLQPSQPSPLEWSTVLLSPELYREMGLSQRNTSKIGIQVIFAIPLSNYSQSNRDGWFVISFTDVPAKNAIPFIIPLLVGEDA